METSIRQMEDRSDLIWDKCMLKDRYDNLISTESAAARDKYIIAIDLILAGGPGIVEAFESVVAIDPGFALGHVGLARARQYSGDGAGARVAIKAANELNVGLNDRQRGHINAFDLLLSGQSAKAYEAIRSHVDTYPRDALVAQTCTSIFGLIGFSGLPGREAEMLAYNAALLPHYGEDWWCMSQYAFALCETGNLDKASDLIDRSLAINPLNANGSHVRSHIYYEAGETELGISYLGEWLKGYDRKGMLHGHLSWHVALWSLGQGDSDTMWKHIDADVKPGAAEGLPINVLTDTASILFRAELAGVVVPKERWTEISDYAMQLFPKTSLDFIDFHAAIAHAMAGNEEELLRIASTAKGGAAELVGIVANAFKAIAGKNWKEATTLLTAAMADHARLGGSRAQRDLFEFALANALLKLGRSEEAGRLLSLHRPSIAATNAVHGLAAH